MKFLFSLAHSDTLPVSVPETLAVSVNWWAVIAAAAAAMVIGAMWYGPMLFAKPWLKAVGKKAEDIKNSDANTGYIIAAVASLVQAYVIAHFVTYVQAFTGVIGIAGGFQTGLWLWLGLVATTMLTNHVFDPNNPKKELLLINWGHYLAVILAQSVILAVWN